MIPPNAMPERRAAILAAVHHIYTAEGRVTVRAVARRFDTSTSSVWPHLRALREARLIDWTDGRRGTMRPTFTTIPIPETMP